MTNNFIILLSSNQDAYKQLDTSRKLLLEAFPNTRFSQSLESETVIHGREIICENGGIYLNAIAIGTSSMEQNEMHAFLKDMETSLGRVRGSQLHGMVAIDLDLVEWNKIVLRPKDAAQSYYKACLGDLNGE